MGNRVSTKNAIANLKKPNSVAYDNGSDARAAAADLFGDDEAGSQSDDVQALRAELERVREQLTRRDNNALIMVEDGVRALGRFSLTTRALISPDEITGDELNLIVTFLKDVKGALQFWIGDIVITCLKHDKEAFGKLARYLEIDLDTLHAWVRVCKKIEPTRRRVNLDFSHHAEVINLKDELKGREDEILDYCEKNGLSVQELRAYIRNLLPSKSSPRPVSILFSKDRIPRLVVLKTTYLRVRRGDKDAAKEMKDTLRSYREWLDEIEKSLGLK